MLLGQALCFGMQACILCMHGNTALFMLIQGSAGLCCNSDICTLSSFSFAGGDLTGPMLLD
jgi:hypothetical protein